LVRDGDAIEDVAFAGTSSSLNENGHPISSLLCNLSIKALLPYLSLCLCGYR
jgi:hypothetical protein